MKDSPGGQLRQEEEVRLKYNGGEQEMQLVTLKYGRLDGHVYRLESIVIFPQ